MSFLERDIDPRVTGRMDEIIDIIQRLVDIDWATADTVIDNLSTIGGMLVSDKKGT